MNTTNTFFDKSFMNRKDYYDVHESGFTYRPDQGLAIEVKWEDIKYLENISGERVDIYFGNETPIPIRYETKQFPKLLEMICLKIADIQKGKFSGQKFSITTIFFLHIFLVLTVCGLVLLAAFTANWVSSIILTAMLVPLGFFVLRQVVSITLHDRYFVERSFISHRTVKYKDIDNVGLDLELNQYGWHLSIALSMRSKDRIVIKKMKHIFLLFILLKIKFNENNERGIHGK